jgi:hypothetical protein
MADDDRTSLRARLVAAGYITDGIHYELFQPGSGATIRVALFPDGAVRVSAFDGQMSWKWSADLTEAAPVASFLDAAETGADGA